jgi:hypothetical protein
MPIEKRPVIQMDLDGNFIKEFESVTKAAKQFGELNKYRAGIYDAAGLVKIKKHLTTKKKAGRPKNIPSVAYGYRWKFKEETIKTTDK